MRWGFIAIFLIISMLAPSYGQERVARLVVTNGKAGGKGGTPTATIANFVKLGRTHKPTQDQLEASTFMVYTAAQYDSMRKEDRNKIEDLERIVRILRENVSELSDLNDALTRRIDAMELQSAEP